MTLFLSFMNEVLSKANAPILGQSRGEVPAASRFGLSSGTMA